MTPTVLLPAITLLASIINGALGYGFSSITVPLALFFLSNRVLNPALVVVEVALNGYVLFVNRNAIAAIWRRVLPIIWGLGPGVLTGTAMVSSISPAWMKFVTFVGLLPLILLQAGGVRRPIRRERAAGPFIGSGVGVLYAVTTISGPPLAVLLSNQGMARAEFRAAMGLIRLAESTFTLIAYTFAGLVTVESLSLVPLIVPSLLLGVPTGAWLIRRLDVETFRRVCMSFDAWIVGFGVCTLAQQLKLLGVVSAYGAFGVVIAIDIWLLSRFFSLRNLRFS